MRQGTLIEVMYHEGKIAKVKGPERIRDIEAHWPMLVVNLSEKSTPFLEAHTLDEN